MAVKEGRNKRKEEVKKSKSKIASVLVIISAVILLLSGLASVSLATLFKETLNGINAQLMIETGVEIQQSYILISGIIWIFLAGAIILTKRRIENTNEKHYKWFLLVLSLLILFAGGLVMGIISGIPALIASVIYLRRK